MAPALRPLARLARRLTGLTPRHLRIPYAWLPYHLYDDGTAWSPLAVTLELTYLCNLRCQMCSLVEGGMVTRAGQRRHPDLTDPAGGLRPELSTDDYLVLVRQLARAGVKAVTLTGGEPTLRPDLVTLAAAVKQHPIHLSVITNGSARPDVYRRLVAAGVDAVTVSVDGPRQVHDTVRGQAGSYDRAAAAVAAVAAARTGRRPWLAVSCTVSAVNQHALEGLAAEVGRLGADELTVGHLHYSPADRQRATDRAVGGRVVHLKNPDLPARLVGVDTAALAAAVGRLRAAAGVPVRFTPDLDADGIRRQYTDPGFTCADRCFHPWLAARIDPWGQMYPCWIDVRVGDVREHGFAALWNGPEYRRFRRLIRARKLLPRCGTCSALTDPTWSKVPTRGRGLFRRRPPADRPPQPADRPGRVPLATVSR